MECKYIKPILKPFDNQISNAKELMKRRRCILTDRVGSGKSISILLAFSLLKEHNKVSNLLVLTPLSAYSKKVWLQDINKFTNLKAIDLEALQLKYENSTEKLKHLLSQYDVIYGKHTHVKQCYELLKEICSLPGTILAHDECHVLRNPKSELTVLTKNLILTVKSCWFITGTTLSKNLEDVYNLVNLLYPWYFGTFTRFREDYCLTKEKIIGRKNGRLVKVQNIIGIKNEQLFRQALSNIVIQGQSHTAVQFHYLDYQLSDKEQALYRKIANGIDLEETKSTEDWLQQLLSSDEVNQHHIKDVERYSSRFVYLQACTDGILTNKGTQDNCYSTKIELLLDKLKELVSKKRSCIVYFDYYAALDCVKKRLNELNLDATVLESSGRHVISDTDVTLAKSKVRPYIILGTRASSESVSLFFFSDYIFFHIPVTSSTFTQALGRIARKNTLYPGDLHCWIFRSNDIQLYKLILVSSKTAQMEVVQGEEVNFPKDYYQILSKKDLIDSCKRLLLWHR